MMKDEGSDLFEAERPRWRGLTETSVWLPAPPARRYTDATVEVISCQFLVVRMGEAT